MLKKMITKKCLMMNLHQELCIGKFIALTDKTEIFCFHTLQETSQKDISEKLGISASAVSQRLKILIEDYRIMLCNDP